MSPMTTILLAAALAQPPASPDPRPVPIAGAVVDATGRPAAGAPVWLSEAAAPAEDRRGGPGILDDIPAGPIPGEARALAQAHCGTDGHFAIAIPAEVVARPSPPSLAIWAALPGPEARIAWHRLPRVVSADDPPVRIALGGPARVELRIIAPDRRPVAGARVVPARAGGVVVPEPLGRAIAATTDADGRVAIPRPSVGAIDEVRIEAAGFGVQMRDLEASKIEEGETVPEGTVVTLAPVGRLRGRLAAPHGEPIRGAAVRATSRVGGYAGSGQGGIARASCDERGRFEIAAIAAGMVAFDVAFDGEGATTPRPWPLSRILVRAGGTTEVSIPMRPMVQVRGLVRERGTGRPVAGAAVLWNTLALHGPDVATTNASGAFCGLVAREEILATPTPTRLPVPFFIPLDQGQESRDLPPRGVDEQVLAPVELSRGIEVGGIVTNRRGEPVAGAEVEAIRPTDPPLVRWGRSDAAGRFVLHGIDPRAELALRAWDGAEGSAAASIAPDALAIRPIALTLGPEHATPIGGSVVDPDGRPVAGATVRIWREARLKDQGSPAVVDPIVDAGGPSAMRTDARGRYRTARRFPADCSYVAEASAPGRLPARSPLLAPGGRDRDFPPIVLRRLRAIEGRVVDRRGAPIAGAQVFQSGDGPIRTETTSDTDGRFTLPGFPDGPGLVFARKDGYRLAFAGCDVPSAAAMTVALTRVDEAPAVAYATLPPALPPDEEKALARRLVRPEADRILVGGDARAKYVFLYNLAAFDPEDALERLPAARLADPADDAAIRIAAAVASADENLDEAMALVEAIETADGRAQGYLELIGALPAPASARARPLLDQALLNARAATSTNLKLYLLAQIAARMIEQGETEPARALIREGEDLARRAERGQALARRLADFAGQMLLVDPRAGLPAFEERTRQAQDGRVTVRAFGMDRHLGRAAYHFAARDPAEADRLLRRVSFTLVRPANHYVVAVCARMATADLPRARRLLDLITEDERVLRAYTLGLMAQAIASDRVAASALLDDAYAELEALVDRGWTSEFASIAGVAGRLLPIVAQVDVARLPECLARALALRPPAGGRNDHAFFPEQAAELAISVSQYDRALAARILRPELDAIGAAPIPSRPVGFVIRTGEPTARVLAALATIDPRRAVELAEKLAENRGTRGFEAEARIAVARVLALRGAARRRSIQEHQLNLWNPLQGVD